MKILFYALHFAHFRNFESALCALAERGHEILLLAEEPEQFGGQGLVERLAAAHPRVSWRWSPPLENEPWFPAARKLRQALDYARFLDPRYRSSPKLAERAAERTPRWLLGLTRLPLVDTSFGRRAISRALMQVERLLPVSARAQRFIEERRPDVVLLASITYSRSTQLDHLKAAKAAGVPTGVCVMSWDHLSSKALIHVQPDRMIVWNETQKREAIEMHGVPADRIEITGAQCYDQWFGRRPDRSHEEFCRAVGLPSDRPYVVFVCSAMTPSPGEPEFVREWIAQLRASGDARLREAGVLIRPHPERIKEWAGVDLSGLDRIAFHGRNPIDPEAKADFFDAIYHSTAVVGIVTSAFLEAAIIGRPVLTPMLPRFRVHQEAMLHFRYLQEVEGGVLRVARSLEEHLSQLTAALADPDALEAQNRRFLQAFVRPRGLDVPATPVFVDAIERVGAVEPAPVERPAWWELLARPLVVRAAASTETGVGRWLMLDAHEIAHLEEERVKSRTKSEAAAAKEQYCRERQREQDEKRRLKAEARQGKERHKAARLRAQRRRARTAQLKWKIKQLIGLEKS